MTNVKRTERGYAGHYTCGHLCRYHRNTLLEMNDIRVVVSTVGNYHPGGPSKFISAFEAPEQIGVDRYYETMAFRAEWCEPYWEADVLRQIYFDAPWSIDHYGIEADKEADEMHERVVEEIAEKMERGALGGE